MRAATRRWVLGGSFAVVGVVGGLIGAAIASPGSSSAAPSENGATGTSESCPVSPVADKVLPSVVTISATAAGGGAERAGGTGSGEVIRSDGYILTNNHVIAAAANGGSVDVLFSDGSAAPAAIVGRDALTDLAVLKVTPPRDLKVIALPNPLAPALAPIARRLFDSRKVFIAYDESFT